MYASSLTRWRTGGVEEGTIVSQPKYEQTTRTTTKQKTSTKQETTAKERTLHHIHTTSSLPFFSILIPQVLLPLFRFFIFVFFGVRLKLKPSELWLLASSVNPQI